MNYQKLHEDLAKMVGIEDKSFNAKFIKKDGTGRIMTCHLTTGENLPFGYLTVLENGLPKSVNLNTLVSLEIEGVVYAINKGEWVKEN